MKDHSRIASLVVAAGLLASCTSIGSAQQTLSVETTEPGAAVYLEVEGVAVSEMRVPGLIRGTLGERSFVRDFGYIGTTPLTYSVPTYGERRHVSVPGRFRSGEERYARSGIVRVEHANGVIEERRFTVRNGDLLMSFNGDIKAEPVAEASEDAR